MDWMDKINESIKLSKRAVEEGGGGGGKKGGKIQKKKRKVIALRSSNHEEGGGQTLRVWKKSPETVKALEGAVRGHFLFKSMTNFKTLMDALQPSFCHTGDCVIWQGDEGGK